jgi:hypothetical protein
METVGERQSMPAPRSIGTETATSSDVKKEQALRLVNEWCKAHRCSPENIPAQARKIWSRANVGLLVYAIRNDIGLDIIPTAELLGIEPSEVMALSRDTRAALHSQKPGTTGLGKPLGGSPRQGHAYKGTPEREDTTIREEAKRKVCEIVDIKTEDAFNILNRTPTAMKVRAIVFALVFKLEGHKNIPAELRRYFGMSDTAAILALKRVDKILRDDSQEMREWQEKIEKACAAFGRHSSDLLR